MKIEKGNDPNNLEIIITRDFSAPRELVFDAFTVPSMVQSWQVGETGHSMPTCEIDLRVGGKWRFIWRLPDGSKMGAGGKYVEIKRPERVVHTELFDEDWTGGESLVAMYFTETSRGTRLMMIIRYATTAARDAALKSPMAEGMEAGYLRLDDIINTHRVS